MEKIIFIGILFLMIAGFTVSFYRMINKGNPEFNEELD